MATSSWRVFLLDDHTRVCLEAPPNMVDTDYINANYVFKTTAGGKKVKAYIASQGRSLKRIPKSITRLLLNWRTVLGAILLLSIGMIMGITHFS